MSMVSLHGDSGSSSLECDNCDSGDPPVSRCATCCHFLCEFCTTGHKRGRSTKTHHLMSLEEAKQEGPGAVTRPSLCKEHDGEILKLFCETCDEAICRDCTIVKHREHKYSFVKDAFPKGKASVLKILSETKAKASTLREALDGVLEVKRSVQSCAEKNIEEVLSYSNKLIACVTDRCAELKGSIVELKEAKLKSLEVQEEELVTALGSIQSCVEFTERAFENGSEVEILNMHKQMSTRIQELNSAEWLLTPCADDAFKLKVDDELIKEVGTFGVITDVVTHASASTVTMGHGHEGVMYNTLCGQRVEFTIIAKERDGQKRKGGGDIFEVILHHTLEKINVQDCENGTYLFWFTPNKAGHYQLSVLLMGHHVQGSPFSLFAEEWNLVGISSGNNDAQVQLSEDRLTANFHIYKASYGYWASVNQSWKSAQSPHVKYPKPRSFLRQPLFVVGSLPFHGGRHMWKAKLCNVSNGFSFGIIDTRRISDGTQVKAGSWWVWNAYSEAMAFMTLSSLSSVNAQNSCSSNDIIEMYLNCDDGTLMMYNQRTKQSDIKDGVGREVSPVFRLMTDGDKVSLQVKD